MTSINIDNRELAKFDALAARWWDPQGAFKTLHEINPLRLEFIDEHAQLQGKAVLDVGCGGGILSEAMADRGARVTGIDMAPAPLSVAELHRLESGAEVDYQRTTAEEYATTNAAAFDVVTCLEMLEHVPDPASTIGACARLVGPGGWVFFSTLNRNPKAYLFAILGAEYLLNLLPKGTHEYGKFIRPSELDRWSRRQGLTLTELTGMSYNPLSGRFRLGRDVSVNYLAAYRRPESSA